MKIKYKVEEPDFLEFQLFTVSKSGELAKKAKLFWISLAIAIPVFGYFIYSKINDVVLTNDFVILILIFFVAPLITLGVFYPKYLKRQYKKAFQKFVKENYSKVFGDAAELEFNEEGLFSKGQNAEGRMNLSEIEVINETQNNFFVKLKTGLSVIVPKRELENSNKVKLEFKKLGLEIEEYLDWE